MRRPFRVISLAPTQTEIIAALGGLGFLDGVTEDCDFPEDVRWIPTFGSWHAPDLKKVLEAQPDLVCTFGSHQEELSVVLKEAGLRTYHSDPPDVPSSLRTIAEIGFLLGLDRMAEYLIRTLEDRLAQVERAIGGLSAEEHPRVLRIMHWDPLITVGPGSFQHDVIVRAGGENLMKDGPQPYFTCDVQKVLERDPEAIFFCEPHIRGLLEEDPAWSRCSALRRSKVFLFECGLTCRSGPRIVDMVEQLARALHPERMSLG
ncbi:MAG: ABC transporter substrate-binding protein [Syntrophobacteraceae bacterium]|nr:ABC transporter substrate-binding protein [Syntrophobacteraceae bacterium]